jgi:signal transduction histidine kinase
VNRDLEKAKEHLHELEGLAARSLTELQRLIANLRPSHLDDLGLQAALRWYGEEVESTSSLKVKVEQEGVPRKIPSEIRIALFRVAQEALGNVAKHAQASQAKVVLRFEEGSVGVRVEDDGRGFNMEKISKEDRKTWGLLGMEERASLLGGKFLLDSKPGKGTIVLVTIPYDQEVGVDE